MTNNFTGMEDSQDFAMGMLLNLHWPRQGTYLHTRA